MGASSKVEFKCESSSPRPAVFDPESYLPVDECSQQSIETGDGDAESHVSLKTEC